MRSKARADRIVTNVLRKIAVECGLLHLNETHTRRLVRGSRFKLTASSYGRSERERLPLYEQVCRVDGANVYWKTVYPGNKHAKKQRAEADWVLGNATIVRH